MISRKDAIQMLKEYWGTDRFVFQADFHIPKNITLYEGSRPFGYFRNFRLNGEIIDYPVEYGNKHDRRISIKYIIKNDLKDNQRYEVAVELNNDNYRKYNPFSLRIKSFTKLTKKDTISKYSILEKTVKQIYEEKINIGSPFTMVELANSVESLATDIYSENKRFIYELIQNADDAATDDNAELGIDILDNYVVISHNGAPFDSRDIRGLCSIGIGTKSDDATKTGYKGIGFKSVFGQPDGIVYVKTEDTMFRFDRDFASEKGWNVKWGNKEKWEQKNRITFNCPWQMMPILSKHIDDTEAKVLLNNKNYSVKTAIKIRDSLSLYNDIAGLFEDAKFMLFLRRVRSVRLNSKEQQIHLEKVRHDILDEAVSLKKDGSLLSNWYVKNWIHDIRADVQKELKSDLKTPKKIQQMEKTEISFALKLNETNDKIQPLEENESLIYSYLPTSVREYNFPFIVNCNFLLDAGREKIHKNRIWNEWLFQVIGYKAVQCCAEFAQKNLFSTTYLSLLRNGFYDSSDNLSQKINKGLKFGFDNFSFIRNNKDELCKLHEIYLDPFEVAKIDQSINEKIAKHLNYTIEDLELKEENVIVLSDDNKVLKKYNPKMLDDTLLQGFYASEHLRDFISKENNCKVLQFVRPFEEGDPSGKWYTIVTKHPLIINQDGKVDYITGVCFPMGITTENNGKYQNRLIHEIVFKNIEQDEALIIWLEKLGVTEPGSIAYLEKEIIGNIDACITNENFLELTQFIFNLHTLRKLYDKHYIDLQELPLKTNNGFKKANQCILPGKYNPTIDFSQVLSTGHFVSDTYIHLATPQECRLFFKKLNVTDDVDFIKSSKKNSTELEPAYVTAANSFSKVGHSYPHLIGVFHPNTPSTSVPFYLQTFSFIEETKSRSLAILFWERLFRKFQLKKDDSGERGDYYEKKKPYIAYNIGNDQVLWTLDKMRWGRFPQNITYTLGYFFWQLENIRCIPTFTGMKLSNETFVNSAYNKELGGNFLPVLDIKNQVPDEWRKVLKLKSKFELSDLLEVLKKIAAQVNLKGKLSKDNHKRIGLIYNDLLKELEVDKDNAFEKIRNWSKVNQLISSSKKSVKAQSLIWIKVSGFENISYGIETVFLPTNVEKKHSCFEFLLEAFGVRIIENFSYEADNQKEFYDLKIKLLNLIGPIGLLLKYKMQISELDRFVYERLQKISKTKFISCQNLRPVFRHKSEDIEGETISHYYDKNKNEFLFAINWNDPISLLNISYALSRLISAVKVEKELMVLLGLRKSQVLDYLRSIKLDQTEYETCNSYEDVLTLIKELEEKSRPPFELSNQSFESKMRQPKDEEVIRSEEDENHEKSTQNGTNKKLIKYEFSLEELEQIKKLFGRELDTSELEEENLYAQVKALRYFKDRSYDISVAETGFMDNFGNRLLDPILDKNDVEHKVMCRSARRGVLFFGAYAWTKLGEENTLLYVLTGDTSTDCVLIKSQEELEQKLDSHFKVLRRKNTTYQKLKALIDAENELSDLQMLYKVKGSSFDIIFNPQKNKPGETEGPLTDIGEDI